MGGVATSAADTAKINGFVRPKSGFVAFWGFFSGESIFSSCLHDSRKTLGFVGRERGGIAT